MRLPSACARRVAMGGALALSLAVMLAACGDAGTPTAPAASDTAAVAQAGQRVADAESSAAPMTPAAPAAGDASDPSPAQGDARLDGFGPLRLGMTGAEAQAAWPGLLAAMPDGATRKDCFHANVPGRSYFALMFDGGRFVRYGGSPDDLAAPGGGRRGMDEAALRTRYGDALQASPDRFAPGGKVLAVQPRGAGAKLVFVLRPDGAVNEWYVGLPPQIDFEEGCESAR